MGKLIDADALLETIRQHSYLMRGEWNESDYAMTVTGIEQAIAEQPEAVVRCEDCKYRYEDDCPMRFVEIVQVDDDGYIDHEILYNDNTTDDGYCNRGERRTDE